jgi:hypothetical protein
MFNLDSEMMIRVSNGKKTASLVVAIPRVPDVLFGRE